MKANQIAQTCYSSIWTVQDDLDRARGELMAKTLQQAIARAIAYEFIALDQYGNARAK